MDFVKEIKKWTAAQVIEALDCPERTVYSWRMSERLPPEWVQRLVLKEMKRRRPHAG